MIQRFTLLMLAFATVLLGQATQGSIYGTITDPSGSAIPNVAVTVRSVEQGTLRTTATNDAGEYVVNNLNIGSDVVSVESAGFKRATNPAVTLTVKARVRVDTVMEVGNVTESVQVSAVAPTIKTGTAEVSNIIDRNLIQNLPVLGRNVMSLAALTPGANGGTAGGRQTALSGAAISVGGAPAEGNNFIIEGVSNNMEFSGTLSVTPAMDAVQEFAVQTSQYSAEFGRSSGGVVNIALKSGTNQLHGFAYDYLQNDIFNARPKDFTGANPPKTPLRRNQYGAGAGGRLIRDKVFWFGNYEGLRNPSSSYAQFIVPTAAEKVGDFSRSGYNIFDPLTTRVDPSNPNLRIRDQYPNNVIPAGRASPVGLGLLKYFPDPNFVSPNPAIRNNYLFRQNANERSHQFNIKGDINLTAKDSLSMHESYQKRQLSTGGWLPEERISSRSGLNGNNAGLNYTRLVSPAIINEVRLSYNRTDIPIELLNTDNVVDQFNIPGWITNPYGRGFPTISITNISSPAPIRQLPFGPPFRITENTYQILDTMSWVKGGHSMRFGFGADDQRLARYQARSGGGSMTFNGSYSTQRPGDPVAVPRTGLSDLLGGVGSNFLTQYGFDAIRIRSYRYNAFFQDDWRLTSKVTLNLGLRYDFYRPYREEQDRVGNFDLDTGLRLVPETARRVVRDTLGLPNGDLPAGWQYVAKDKVIPHANRANFAPRLGIAYAPTSKLALRAGWGLFYSVTTANTFNNMGTEGNPFFFDFQVLGDAITPLTFAQGLPSGTLSNVLASTSFSAYYGPIQRKDPRAQKYSATVEYSPWRNGGLSVGYVGQRTYDFPTLVAGNSARVPASTSILSRQPYPNVGFFWQYVTGADSNYNAAILSFNQRLLKGFSLQSNFTWSKALGYNTGSDQTLTNRWDPNYDYGPLDYDLTRRWVSAFTYQEPTLASFPKVARFVLGGWSASGLLTVQSGTPFSVRASGAVLNVGTVGGTGQRADALGDPNLSSSDRSVNRWFNTSAFALPSAYTWGNSGKNILRGPGLRNFDAALQKSFSAFREGHRITFRMEATNLFNHVHLANPASDRSGANFGVISGLQAGPRRMQAALRYDF